MPIFAAESAPASIRGGMTMQWQMWTAFGIVSRFDQPGGDTNVQMLGYVADLAFFYVPVHKPGITGLNWRLMLGSAGFPALIVMCQMPFLPESPRWLMGKGKYKKAYESMLRLRGNRVTAARDIYYMFVLLNEEESIVRGHNRFLELFTIGRNRRAAQGAAILMFGQQFCGVNAIVYYTASIFTNAGFSQIDALLASWGFGMLNVSSYQSFTTSADRADYLRHPYHLHHRQVRPSPLAPGNFPDHVATTAVYRILFVSGTFLALPGLRCSADIRPFAKVSLTSPAGSPSHRLRVSV